MIRIGSFEQSNEEYWLAKKEERKKNTNYKLKKRLEIIMKIFQQLQKNLAFYGIASYQHPFNLRIRLSLIIYSLAIILIFIHIFYEAKTFQEYANSIFMATAQIATSIIFTFNAWQMQSFFDCVKEAEEIVNDSKLKP